MSHDRPVEQAVWNGLKISLRTCAAPGQSNPEASYTLKGAWHTLEIVSWIILFNLSLTCRDPGWTYLRLNRGILCQILITTAAAGRLCHAVGRPDVEQVQYTHTHTHHKILCQKLLPTVIMPVCHLLIETAWHRTQQVQVKGSACTCVFVRQPVGTGGGAEVSFLSETFNYSMLKDYDPINILYPSFKRSETKSQHFSISQQVFFPFSAL